MLLHRILTSFALLFVILGAVFGLPENFFILFITMIVGLAVWEWTSLAGFNALPARCIYLLAMLALMYYSLHLPSLLFLVAGVGFWLVGFIFVCFYPAGKQLWGNTTALAIIGVVLFLPGWRAFAFLREQQYFSFHLLLLLGLVAAADIGAFFTGRAFGKRQLAVRVSPNKTWEGFAGGLIASCLLVTIVAFLFISDAIVLDVSTWLRLLPAVLLVASSSVLGDLFESMIKRFRDVKDSGTILPGHGGMLDRIDGLTAAAPVYALVLLLIFAGSV